MKLLFDQVSLDVVELLLNPNRKREVTVALAIDKKHRFEGIVFLG